jgi:HlyD family secretion protein
VTPETGVERETIVNRRWKMQHTAALIGIVIVAAGAAWLARGPHGRGTAAAVTTQPVERHDIALTIEASGTIEPVDLVEVKSKASGTITSMPVSVGSRVTARDLLVQIDTRDVRNQYDQTLAALRAAQVKADISKAQKARSDSLNAQGVITADENETAMLDDANAEAALVTARTNLDLAKQRLDDATVRAPVAGTVLSQSVTEGQVISSATSSVSGGTTLLTMADLSHIRMRTLVAETDVGNVRPGQGATVTVDAFPNRTFEGTVEKVEPQAVVAQSVTNFPVLVSLSNDDGLLLPGMNGEVSLVVDRRGDVLAVPVDAVRSQREALVIAPSLGLVADSVRVQLERQRLARRSPAGGMGSRDSLGAGRPSGAMRDSMRARWAARGFGGPRGGQGGGGSGGQGAGGAGSGWSGNGAGSASGGSGAGAANRAQVVFVKSAGGIEPRIVRLGLSDFDWSQVISGVEEGEQVVMLGVAQAQATRTQTQAEVRQRVGTMPGALGGSRGGGGGGGGGTRTRTGGS